MNTKKIFLAVTILITLFVTNIAAAQVLIPTKGADKVLLNGIWKFKYIASSNIGADSTFYHLNTDVSHWGNIKTPGNWELQGFAEPFYGKNLKEGTGLLYRF